VYEKRKKSSDRQSTAPSSKYFKSEINDVSSKNIMLCVYRAKDAD